MSHVGVGPRAVMRSVAFLTAGALAVPALAACTSGEPKGKPLAGQDTAAAARARIADGATLRWAADSVPETLNAFQADADATTTRVAQAVLPSMYRMDETGRPVRNPDYLESAEVVDTEPKQVVVYKLNQQAVWSDGREIGAADFAAQWRALSGRDSAYWTARNAGYDRIEKIERGGDDLEVKVTFSRPYADWKSLFTPLYPKDVMGTPDAFNDGARRELKTTAGPFAVKKVDTKEDEVVLTGNPRWWGEPAKLEQIVLRAAPRDKRVSQLAAGKLDLAEIDPETAEEVAVAAGPRDAGTGTPLMGPQGSPSASRQGRSAAQALRSWAIAKGSDEDDAEEETLAREEREEALAKRERRQRALSGFEVRKSLEPAYTQLALNGADGPLADERVRRAVARALDRGKLAKAVLKPLGLPAEPVGSHVALAGQPAYADGSGALGGQNAKEARALLADAGWVPGGPVKKRKEGEKAAGAEGDKDGEGKKSEDDDDGTYIVGEDEKNEGGAKNEDAGTDQESGEKHSSGKNTAQGGAPAPTPQGHRRTGRRRGPRRQGRQGAHPALRAPLRPRLRRAAHRRRPRLGHAGEDRRRHRHHQGAGRELLQGPHRLRRVRPGALLLARLRLPRHRRPPHLRQARPGRRRLPERRAELHPGRHRPGRPALRPGHGHAGRGGGAGPAAQGRLADLGGGRLHPALPAPPAGRGPQEPRQRGRLRLRDAGLPGHGLPEEGRERLPALGHALVLRPSPPSRQAPVPGAPYHWVRPWHVPPGRPA
ncbi:ABC transporter family substrate-binding protein [Streptomyces sp. CA-100214]